MNIIDYSINLGHSLRKSREGKLLTEKRENLIAKYNVSSFKDLFNQFMQVVDDGKGKDNFFSWFIALEKLRHYLTQVEDKVTSLEKMAVFILKDEDVGIISNLYKSMGESLNDFQKTILGSKLVSEIQGITINNNIRNKMSDLQASIQRSGLTNNAIQVAKQHQNILLDKSFSKYDEFINKANYQPYSSESIKYLCEHSEIPLDVRKLYERIRLVQYIANKGIFEGFEESNIEINSEYILSSTLVNKELISNIKFSHNYGYDFLARGAWLYKIKDNDSYYYVIANSRTIHFPCGNNNEWITDINGLFYPCSDYRFFEKKSIFYEDNNVIKNPESI